MDEQTVDLREQRRNLRLSLMSLGFEQKYFTNDIGGTGVYTETWSHALLGTVTINWNAREQ